MMNIEEFKNSANSQTVTDKECIGILLDKIYSMPIEKLYVKRRWSTCDPLSDYLLPAVDIDISKERLSKFKYYNIAEIVRKQQAQLQLDDTEDKTIKDNYYTALFYFSQMMACFVPFQKSKRR